MVMSPMDSEQRITVLVRISSNLADSKSVDLKVCVCVCVSERERERERERVSCQLVSARSSRGVPSSIQAPPLVEEKSSFQNL
jgi:hypothetical protein